METKNKYYTPKIEEFCIGFDYERYDYGIKEHSKFTVTIEDFYSPVVINQIKDELCRVKYLDREDIEDLGYIAEQKPLASFDKGEYWIKDKSGTTIIDFWNGNIQDGDFNIECYNTMFKIKNKSELKKLLLQLGVIKNEK